MTFVLTTYFNYLYSLLIRTLFAFAVGVLILAGHASAQTIPSERLYTVHLNDFNSFLNGVWKDVYQWDSGREVADNNGHTIGGWKSIIKDNLAFEHYTEYGGTWEGFCVSKRDFVYNRPDPLNQFTATTRGGKDGQGTPYMIAYYGVGKSTANNCRITLRDGMPCVATGMYVTNTYYNYLSVMNGDGFARRFDTGDWFLLTAYGYDQNGSYTGSSEFYLADYRSENTSEHYIVQDWRWFNLIDLGEITSVEFILTSSDNAVYGMNTPAYFCMDQFTLSLLAVKEQPEALRTCAGAAATFRADATSIDYYNASTGTNSPQFQWRKNGVDIPLANQMEYTIPVVKMEDTALYSCYITNMYETELYKNIFKDATYKADVLTDPVALTILPGAPVIIDQSVSKDVEIASEVQFQAHASGENSSYTWFKNGLEVSSDASFVLPSVAYADTGLYICVVSNGCGSVSINPIALNVHMSQQVYPNPNRMHQFLTLKGYKGYTFTLVDSAGLIVDSFVSDSDFYSYFNTINIGAYILKGVHPEQGTTAQLIIII